MATEILAGALAACALAAAGCGQSASAAPPAAPPAKPAPSAPAPAAKPTAFHPDDDPACSALATLAFETEAWMSAASPQPHHAKVAALWPTLPPACRGGTFYLVAAELVGRAADARLATADGAVAVTSPADAIARGLAAEPDHPRLLARVAFADDLATGDAPPLPAGACERARGRGGDAWASDASYVCALAAIHTGAGTAALGELDRITDPGSFPDLQVRRAQALALAGRTREARALARPATAALGKAHPRFDLTAAAIAALKKKLPR